MPDIFFYRGFCTGVYVGIKTDHFASESQKRFVFGCVNEVVVAVVSVCNTMVNYCPKDSLEGCIAFGSLLALNGYM